MVKPRRYNPSRRSSVTTIPDRKRPRRARTTLASHEAEFELGIIEAKLGRIPEAEGHLSASLAIREDLVRADPEDVGGKRDQAKCLLRLGILAALQKQPDRTDERLTAALTILEGLPVPTAEDLVYISCVHASWCILAARDSSLPGKDTDGAKVDHLGEAINFLEKAEAAGFSDHARLEREAGFDAVREDPRFEEIVDRMSSR